MAKTSNNAKKQEAAKDPALITVIANSPTVCLHYYNNVGDMVTTTLTGGRSLSVPNTERNRNCLLPFVKSNMIFFNL